MEHRPPGPARLVKEGKTVIRGNGASAYNTALTQAGDGPIDILSHEEQLYPAGVTATRVILSPTNTERVRLDKGSDGNYTWRNPRAGAPASLRGLQPW